jgi:hypothetical protein
VPAVSLLPSFISDLQEQSDANFARRVFMKLFDSAGDFKEDGNDHRYHGIPNAWIRYISQGSSAFRVIYIRDGNDVQIFRAGPHSVEDKLSGPKSLSTNVHVTQTTDPHPSITRPRRVAPAPTADRGRIICSLKTPTLQDAILARSLQPHRDVTLVSPFLSLDLLVRTARLGRMLDRQLEDGSRVTLITRPPGLDGLEPFKDLEARGVSLLFHSRLHAKLYAFKAAPERLGPHAPPLADMLVLGSANLTTSGFAGVREKGNEELSYRLPLSHSDDVESFLALLAMESVDLVGLKLQLARARKKIQ